MAPLLDKSSRIVTEKIEVSGIRVDALMDTGASTSCCTWKWYQRWKSRLGALDYCKLVVLGIGDSPVSVKGITKPVSVIWDGMECECRFVVITTLQDFEVLIGMDIMSSLRVQIDTAKGRAYPTRGMRGETVSAETIRVVTPERNTKIPAGKARVLFLQNKFSGLTLFEPGEKLPIGIQGIPSLSEGPLLKVQLDNRTEEDIILGPEWSIGQVYPVQVIKDSPSKEPTRLPEIPCSLTGNQRSQLRAVLKKYADVFARQGDPITSTPMIQHEIYTKGPPIRLPSRRQNPLVREQEQQQVNEMLKDNVIRPSMSPWASPVVM